MLDEGRVGSAPALVLAPVELPAPSEPPSPRRSLASRALLSVVLLVGIFVVGLGTIAALVAVNVALLMANYISFALVIATLVAVVGLGRGLFAAVKRPPAPDDELTIPPGAEPELVRVIEEVAAIVGTDAPHRIVVVPEVNAYVREFGPFMGLARGKRTLAIGAPLLDALDVTELRAVLAHELGHFAGGDTRLGPLTYRTSQCLAQVLVALRGNIASVPFVAYAKFQYKVTAAIRRDQELIADRASVRVAGRQAAADALWAIEVAARAEAVLKDQYLAPLVRVGARPADLGSGLVSLLADPRRVDQLSALAVQDADEDPWASHPPTPVRIQRVAALADSDTGRPARDRRAARVLLRDPDRWIREVNDAWLRRVIRDVSATQVVGWDAWTDQVVAPTHQRQAEQADRALQGLGLPPGPAGVRQALGAGRERELAAALVAQGWRAPGANERTVLLRTALASTTGEAARRHGARWVLSWSGPPSLVEADGTPCELLPAVDAALEGRWEQLDAILAPGRGAADATAAGAGDGRVAGTADPRVEPTAPIDAPAPAPGSLGGWVVGAAPEPAAVHDREPGDGARRADRPAAPDGPVTGTAPAAPPRAGTGSPSATAWPTGAGFATGSVPGPARTSQVWDGAGAPPRPADPAPVPSAQDPAHDHPRAPGAVVRPPLLEAPQPPFEPAPAPGRWQVVLKGTLGKKLPIVVGDDTIELGGRRLAFDDIVHARVHVRPRGNLSFKLTIGITTRFGGAFEVVLPAGGDKDEQRAVAAANYVVNVLVQQVAPRIIDELQDRVERGQTVQVSGLVVRATGLSAAGAAVETPWEVVCDPVRAPAGLSIGVGTKKGLLVKHGTPDLWVLPDLIARFRTRFG